MGYRGEEEKQETTVVIEVDDTGLVDQMTMAGLAAQRSRLRLHELMNQARDKTLPEVPSAEANASLIQEINFPERQLSVRCLRHFSKERKEEREKLTSHVLQIEININTSPLFKNSEEIFNSMGEDDENVQVEPGGLENTAVFSVSCPVHCGE